MKDREMHREKAIFFSIDVSIKFRDLLIVRDITACV